jgi:creatinine amidohydrolase
MTWKEYQQAIKRATIVLPVGSLEQHGPHLPLGTDVVIPLIIATRVAERLKAMVLPPIAYGYKSQPTSGGGQMFPGTTSLEGDTLVHLALDILRETYRHGGRRFLIIIGHYENTAFVGEAVDVFLRDSPEAKVVILAWWDLISPKLVEELWAGVGFPGWDTEHASIAETSLMLYLAPELVRADKILDDQAARKPNYQIFPPPKDIIPRSGVLYKATFASREKGEKLAREAVDAIVEIALRELK